MCRPKGNDFLIRNPYWEELLEFFWCLTQKIYRRVNIFIKAPLRKREELEHLMPIESCLYRSRDIFLWPTNRLLWLETLRQIPSQHED